ncbi:MAG: exodeoxyribonuclease V subunit alpha [Methylotetracoccus sp.]
MSGGRHETIDALTRLEQQGALRAIDLHFATRLARRAGPHAEAVALAACWSSFRLGQGHVCIALADVAGGALFPELPALSPIAPPLNAWRTALLGSPVVGPPGSYHPLILDQRNRLYLHRYFDYERQVAEGIASRCDAVTGIDQALLRTGLERMFPPSDTPAPPLTGRAVDQRTAAAIAVLRRFAVISGGPGTGKTTTVTRLMALLIEQRPDLRIALAAPTGKAAARLNESILQHKARLLDEKLITNAVAERIPDRASTLHRLLGTLPGRTRYRHDADNPLPVDVLVVDEASMIDLPLMAHTVRALLPASQLILVGDMRQLASVEAGQVFGDICGSSDANGFTAEFAECLRALDCEVPASGRGDRESALSDGIAVLGRSFRFGDRSGVGLLARAIDRGDGDACRTLFDGGQYDDIAWLPAGPGELPALLGMHAVERFRPYLEATDPATALKAFERFRLLCAVREGPFGTRQANELIERALSQRGWISGSERWYHGRPVIILRNDYALKLFNGDIGLLWRDEDGVVRAKFPDAEGRLRSLLPTRLPDHETVFAMTVHKSQGSEFDEVLLLTGTQQSAVLTRELLYTGLTRARQRASFVGAYPVFEWALGRTIERATGLPDRLAAEMRAFRNGRGAADTEGPTASGARDEE